VAGVLQNEANLINSIAEKVETAAGEVASSASPGK
jgi:hypothetical protein